MDDVRGLHGDPMRMDAAISSMILADKTTPMDRWVGLRDLRSTSPSEFFGDLTLPVAIAIMVSLISLLLWVAVRRRRREKEVPREPFAETAGRRGLSMRERQILLAVVVRSGLGQSEDIFTAADAFDKGAAKLQEECGRTRTAPENESLKLEIAGLRTKLSFDSSGAPRGSASSKRPASRDIPVGKIIELTRRQRDRSSVRAEVIRNDAVELAVQLSQELNIQVGDKWQVRYDFGTAFWEFDTVVVRCEGMRLILNHSEQVRFVDRRRFPRVAVHVPALLARLPSMHPLLSSPVDPPSGLSMEAEPLEPPAFLSGTVTEMAGPGLRIEVPIPAGVGDRVLILFRLDRDWLPSSHRTSSGSRTIAVSDIGRILYVKTVEGGYSLSVELGGLSEAEIDELVRFAHTMETSLNAGSPPVGAGHAAASHAGAGEETP
jgi:hypothetical protein